jgi:hypothetical protein
VHEIEQLIIMRSLHIKRAKITKIQQWMLSQCSDSFTA